MAQILGKFLSSFKQDERGAFSVVIVGMFTSMILIGGTAIDLLQFESVRSGLQRDLDRSVLAAASMRQLREPETVVRDYMSKASGHSQYNVTMNAEDSNVTLTGRTVSAAATATYSTYFLRIAGMDSLNAHAASRASEVIPNLEVSLVLDVSSSMLGGQMNSLKTAANEFVDTVITEDVNTRTSISIVPYATNVAVPQSMWNNYNTEDLSSNSHCMIFAPADYGTVAISSADLQLQWPHYSNRGTFNSGLEFEDCNTAAWSEIMPLSTSKVDLHNKIDALVASGDSNADNTAGHIGAKWGAALLDPEASHLSSSGAIPTAYDEADVLKVMVVMTDGQNTDHYQLLDEYRYGLSDMYVVFADTSSSNFKEYVYKSVTPDIPDTGLYYERNGDSLGASYTELPYNISAGYATQYTWSEVWELMSTEGYERLIDADHSIEIVYSDRTKVDIQMLKVCEVAKNAGIIIYTISFKVAPNESKQIFEQCASTPGHYFDVDETSISAAFASISVAIQKLKLSH